MLRFPRIDGTVYHGEMENLSTPVAVRSTKVSSSVGRIRRGADQTSSIASIAELRRAGNEMKSFQGLVSQASDGSIDLSDHFAEFTATLPKALQKALSQEARGLAESYFAIFGKTTGILIMTLEGNRRIRPFVQRKSCRVFRAYFERSIFITSTSETFQDFESIDSAVSGKNPKILRGVELHAGDTFFANRRVTDFSIGTGNLQRSENVYCFIGIHENLNR